jgi:sugar lactone lactonase YvrE
MSLLRQILIYAALFATAIDASGQTIATFAGRKTAGYSGDGGPASAATINKAVSLAADSAGNLYVADFYNQTIRKIDAAGTITTIGGNRTIGYSGDGGPATAAQLNGPWGIAVDNDGNVFVADKHNHAIRKINADGIITTVAGNGTAGYSGDGGPATAARLNHPLGLCLDVAGNLYIADNSNTVVRKISPSGIISTFAGNNHAGSSGDGRAATAASLRNVRAVAADGKGNIYISDTWNSIIRKVDTRGIITTYAGFRVPGYRGDGGPATLSCLHYPVGITFDADDNLYIADNFNHAIRKVSAEGKMSTVAGTGTKGYSGDGGPATAAQTSHPTSLVISNGHLYFTEFTNNLIRTLPLAAARQEAVATTNIRVFPNPVADIVNVELPAKHATGNLQISDMQGKVVEQRTIETNTNKYSCNLERLSAGTYLVHILAGAIDYSTKISVTH